MTFKIMDVQTWLNEQYKYSQGDGWMHFNLPRTIDANAEGLKFVW